MTTKNIKAKFVTSNHEPRNTVGSSRNTVGYFRKENHFTRQLTCVAVVKGKVVELAQARFYGTNATSYCCIWIMTPECWISGGAKAGGYGYHRYSAAMERALAECGVELSREIGGVGDTAMQDALAAVGRAMGHKSVTILKAHG